MHVKNQNLSYNLIKLPLGNSGNWSSIRISGCSKGFERNTGFRKSEISVEDASLTLKIQFLYTGKIDLSCKKFNKKNSQKLIYNT